MKQSTHFRSSSREVARARTIDANMDSYTAALRQVAERHAELSTNAPSWLRNASQAASQPQPARADSIDSSSKGDAEPPPRPPPKSYLRSRPSFTQLEKVVEEAGFEDSISSSPVTSMSGTSLSSAADSVQTAIYQPKTETSAKSESASDSSGKYATRTDSRLTASGNSASNSSGDSYSGTEFTSSISTNSASPDGSDKAVSRYPRGGELKNFEPNASGRNKRLPNRAINDNANKASKQLPSTSTRSWQEPASSEEAAPAPIVPGESNADRVHNHDSLTSHLKSAAHNLASKLKSNHEEDVARPATDYQQPRIEAIDAIIAGLDPPRRGHGMYPDESSAPSSPARTRSYEASGKRSTQDRARPAPQTHETIRDGVPIQMRQKSGVWVESVEGAELTSTQDQQRNVPKGQPIAEREAEDIPEIEVPEDPWNNLPPYIRLEYTNDDANMPPQRPTTRSRKEQATASWAQNQAEIRDSRRSPESHRPEPASEHHSSSVVTPWAHARPQTQVRQRKNHNNVPAGAPFYYEQGRVRANGSHTNVNGSPLQTSNSGSMPARPSGSKSSPHTSLFTNVAGNASSSKLAGDDTNPEPGSDLQAKIAQSAAAIEQSIYGLPPARGRGQRSRFESIELV